MGVRESIYNKSMNYSCILLGAGKGERTGLSYNKVFYPLNENQTVLDGSLDLFQSDPDCRQILLVCSAPELEYVKEHYAGDKVEYVTGGATRQDSVKNGLDLVKEDYVFIHDGARPFIQEEQIHALKEALKDAQGAILGVPCTDTIKIVSPDGYIESTPKRELLWQAQTPQAFETSVLKEAHEKARNAGYTGTDDAQLCEHFTDARVRMVKGDYSNRKITNPSDLTNL